jgi:cytochrome c-type protein NapB
MKGGNIMKSIFILLIALSLVTVGAATAANEREVSEDELGLRKSPVYSEESTEPVHGEIRKEGPGESKPLPRSFENSPPLIPHDITGMLPLAQTENMCLDCHMPEEAVSQGATPIPPSHFVDFDSGKKLGKKLDGDRYNCMQCHVIQTEVSPAVRNLFKGEFRDEKGRYRSNLIDILNEGVKEE